MASSATKQAKTAPKTAPQQERAGQDEAAAPARKAKRRPLKILLLLSLLLGAGAGGAWYFLAQEEPLAPRKPGSAKAATAKPVSSKPPVFLTLEPFTVNLQLEDSGPQYLQVGLALKAADETLAEAVKLHMPEIRNRVLLLLSSKKASEISTLDGKKTLSADLTREIAQPLAGSTAAKGLDSVLFTSFVIQ